MGQEVRLGSPFKALLQIALAKLREDSWPRICKELKPA